MRHLELDEVLEVRDVEHPLELVLRAGDAEKVLPPQFVVMVIEVAGQRLEVTAAHMVNEWISRGQG